MSQISAVLLLGLNLIGTFNFDWGILTGSCKFLKNFSKYCRIDQMNSSTLPNELISIFQNASIGTVVKDQARSLHNYPRFDKLEKLQLNYNLPHLLVCCTHVKMAMSTILSI